MSANTTIESLKKRYKKFKWGWPTEEYPRQRQIQHFDPTLGQTPAHGIRHAMVNPESSRSAFSKFIGNPQAIRSLGRAAFSALEKPNHACAELAWAFLGPSSSGKTTLARLFAKVLDLPFIEISAGVMANTDSLLYKINEVLTREWDMPLIFRTEEDKLQPGRFKLPPLICFIDEVHDLPRATVNGLLNAIESKNPYLQTPIGFYADCSNVTWAIATTHRGALFGPFDTRFTKIELSLYTLDELARIIKLNYPEWDDEICAMVAKYSGRIPREALAFAQQMILESKIRPNDWDKIVRTIATDNRIDEFGMHLCRVSILRALGNNAMSIENLANAAGVERTVAELRKFWLPSLLARTKDQAPLIKVAAGRGCVITPEGVQELVRRGIEYKEEAL